MTAAYFHEVWAAQSWPTNADMIEDVVRLDYIRPADAIIDLTYGRGKWWTKYTHPGPFAALCGEAGFAPPPADNVTVMVGYDFRDLPEATDDQTDVVVFDPPYVSQGGRKTSTIPDFNSRYGLVDAPASPQALHEYNAEGLVTARRICKPGGLILVKCMDYVSSGKLQMASIWMYEEAEAMGLQVHDRLIHVGSPGPQPKNNLDGTPRRQVHSRSNHSTLWVFKKPGRRRR